MASDENKRSEQQFLTAWNIWAKKKGLNNDSITDYHRYEFFQSVEREPYLFNFVRSPKAWKGVMELLRRPLI